MWAELKADAEKLGLIEISVLKPNQSNLFASAGFNGGPFHACQDIKRS